jgi:hypothetical protein
VKGYEHRCRKQGCGFKELRATDEQSRCPRCGRSLWPKAVPKDYRFHHLRHTNASSLLKLRESLPLVQDILGHADPETTRRIYGHLELDDKRRALAQLRFRVPAGDGHAGAPPSGAPAGGEAGVNGAPAVRPSESGKTEAADPPRNRSEISGLVLSGRLDLNQRPLAPQALSPNVQAVVGLRKCLETLAAVTRARPALRRISPDFAGNLLLPCCWHSGTSTA